MVLHFALERGYDDQVYKFCVVLRESLYKSKNCENLKLFFKEKKEPSNLEKLEWVKHTKDQMCKSQDCTYSLLVVNALFLLIHYANTYATFYEAKVKTNQALL